MASASAATLPGGTSNPVFPWITISFNPPAALAMMGRPNACARAATPDWVAEV
jgi:hypothetical protein